MTVQYLLFCAHTLYLSDVTNTFLLVRSSVVSKQLLCFLHGQGQKSEQKPTTKNFVGFHNHSPLLTMVCQLLRVNQSSWREDGYGGTESELKRAQEIKLFVFHDLSCFA